MPTMHNATSSNENSDNEDNNDAAEQIQRQTERMFKYLVLYRGTMIELFQGWTARRQNAVDEVLNVLKAIPRKQDPEDTAKEYRNLLVASMRRLGADAFDTWFHGILLAQRNLRTMQKNFGEQAQEMSQDMKENTGFDFTKPMKESVVDGVRDVLAIREPVNYEGVIALDIARFNESAIGWEKPDGRVARLQRGEAYELHVQFAPDKLLIGSPARGVVKSIDIRDGDDQPKMIPFRLLVDFGFIELSPEERTVTVPRDRASTVELFPFSVPSAKQQSSSYSADVTAAVGGRLPPDERLQPEISVSVYQHGRYLETCVLPIAVPT
jgi:hypothetical protein